MQKMGANLIVLMLEAKLRMMFCAIVSEVVLVDMMISSNSRLDATPTKNRQTSLISFKSIFLKD